MMDTKKALKEKGSSSLSCKYNTASLKHPTNCQTWLDPGPHATLGGRVSRGGSRSKLPVQLIMPENCDLTTL
jgi:hypothetical protein